MEKIRVAVPKGNSSISAIFLNKGYALPDDFIVSRKYIVPIINTNLEFVLAKPTDIPAYVEYGAADLGIVGKEALLEGNRNVYELLDLGISQGSLSLIGKSESKNPNPRIATAYPKTTLKYFNLKGKEVEIIKLHGVSELALVTGLADYIVEVNDKKFLDSGLFELERICNVSHRLIANRVSYQVKRESLKFIYRELSQSIAVK